MSHRGAGLWAWVGAGIVGLLLLAALVWWVAPVQAWLGIAEDATSGGPDRGVLLSEVSDNPDAMWGRRVTISGEVDAVVAPGAVVLGEGRVLPFFDEDLVPVLAAGDLAALAATPADEPVAEGDVVQVTGTVRRLDGALAAELGIALGGDLADHEGGPAIVADTVTRNPPEGFPGDTERPGPSAGLDVSATINDVVHDTDDVLGQVVTVSGEVEHIFGPHAFQIGDEKLLVVSAVPRDDVFVEPTAYVTGTVRRFDLAAVEQELGVDLDDEAFAGFDGDPVLVADTVNLVA